MVNYDSKIIFAHDHGFGILNGNSFEIEFYQDGENIKDL